MPTAGKGTYRELLRQGEHLLRRRVHPAPCDDAATDAFLLLEKVSGLNRTNYPLKKDARYPQAEREEYLALLRRRAAGEPVQYILGEWDFMGRDFTVGPGVLIPRPETEQLTEAAIDYLRKRPECRVLELCGGSGCIAITVAKTLPAANVTVLELSPEAMEYMRANMARHKADNVTAVQGDAYEPHLALDGGTDGLDFYRGFNDIYPRMLAPGGLLLYEIGEEQGEAVAALLRNAGLERVAILRDVYGQPRNVLGYAPDKN